MPKKIYTEEEARERKNARQKEYAKRTKYAANQKYIKENYTRLILDVKKDIAEPYKMKCKEMNIPYSQPLQQTILEFLNDPEKWKNNS